MEPSLVAKSPLSLTPMEFRPEWVDSSGPLFSMYSKMGEEEDKKMADIWHRETDGILIFSGLFSAAVAQLIAVTAPSLQQNSQDTSAFYLKNIYELQVSVNSNRSSTSISVTPAQLDPFSPPTSAVWVNSLLFLTLIIILTCAMLATLLQQWVQRYLRTTHSARHRPHDRARIRAFFARGIDKFYLSRVVNVLPTLIQLALFLFFAAILIYLFSLNITVFRAVAWWVAISGAIYMLITLMPIIWHECPYHLPLSSVIWYLYSGILYLVFLFLCCICCCYDTTVERFDDLSTYYHDQIFRRMENLRRFTIRKQESEIDGRVLRWTFETLIEDHQLETFLQYILGFRRSKVVRDPQQLLQRLGEWKFSSVLVLFLHRTWLSHLVPESDKARRLVVCVKVADAARLLDAIWQILDGVFTGGGRVILESVETGHSLRSLGDTNDQDTPLCAQSIVGCIIANVRNRDDRWIALAKGQLCPAISMTVFDTYVGQGDSILLANLIHVTRQFYTIHDIILNGRMLPLNLDTPIRVISHFTRLLSNFDIRETLPALQHEFCALWNYLVEDARRSGPDEIPIHILIGFRHLYLALHQDTNVDLTAFSASTADDNALRRVVLNTLCDRPDHLSALTPIAIHDDGFILTIPSPIPIPIPAHTTSYRRQPISDGVLSASPRATHMVMSSDPLCFEDTRTLISSQDEHVSRIPSIIHTSSIANSSSTPLATHSGGATPQDNRETTMVPPMTSGSSPPSPSGSGRAGIVNLHSHEDPDVNQSDTVPPVSSLSSSITTSSHVTPPEASVSGPNNSTIVAIFGTHRNTRDRSSSRLELTRRAHRDQSEPPAPPNIAMTTLQPPNPYSSRHSL